MESASCKNQSNFPSCLKFQSTFVVQQHGRHDKRRVPTCRLVSHRNSATSPTKCFSACRARDVWLGTMRVMLQAPDSAPRSLGSSRHLPNAIGWFGMTPRNAFTFDPVPPLGHTAGGGEGRRRRQRQNWTLWSSRERAKPRQAPAPDLTKSKRYSDSDGCKRTSIVVLGEVHRRHLGGGDLHACLDGAVWLAAGQSHLSYCC